MIGAFASDFFAVELATLLFWGLNAIWAIIVLHGVIVHRSLASAYFVAAIWALTVCLLLAVPMLAKIHLSLADSFFLLSVILTGAQAMFDLISTIGDAFGYTESRDGD